LLVLRRQAPFLQGLYSCLKAPQLKVTLLLVVAEVHDNDSKHHNYNSNDKQVIVITLSLSLSLSASGPPMIVILSAYFVLSAGVFLAD
jgi:uncharacterized protein YqhQ